MSWITPWRDAAKRLRLGAKPYVMWVFRPRIRSSSGFACRTQVNMLRRGCVEAETDRERRAGAEGPLTYE